MTVVGTKFITRWIFLTSDEGKLDPKFRSICVWTSHSATELIIVNTSGNQQNVSLYFIKAGKILQVTLQYIFVHILLNYNLPNFITTNED